MTICYFTASGNCLYVARRIGETLLSIPQLMRQDKIENADDAVGIVCPVYAVELPFMIVDFMKKADIQARKERRVKLYLAVGEKVADAFRTGMELKKSFDRNAEQSI
jgi:hypothetical protein